jgi:formylglycine-generating enzyme required for sulfatase activity
MVPLGEADAFCELAAPFVWTDGQPPRDRGRHPVTLVTYDDAAAFCAWLQSRTGKPFRLPTEAEWEKAARGGVERRRFPWGDEVDPALANFLRDPALKMQAGTHEVGSYPANGYHLFEIVGNVWQWVSDWYAPDYYARAQYLNPPGPEDGHLRIVRGGSWVNHDANFLRCGNRHHLPADSYSYSIGLRVAYSPR